MSEPVAIPTKQSRRKKPSTISIYREEDTHPIEIKMADVKDWGVIFEDILSVDCADGSKRFFPTAGLREWKVEEDA